MYEIDTQGNKETSIGTAGAKFSDEFLPTLNPKSTTAPFFDDTDWSCFVTQVKGLDSCLSKLDLSLIYTINNTFSDIRLASADRISTYPRVLRPPLCPYNSRPRDLFNSCLMAGTKRRKDRPLRSVGKEERLLRLVGYIDTYI